MESPRFAPRAGWWLNAGMDENRVKDPLGDYEAMKAKAGPDTTFTGLKLLVVVPVTVVGIGAALWGVVAAFRSLFGG